MILVSILLGLCNLAMWIFAFFGIKNYEYNNSENLLIAKILITIILLVELIGMCLIGLKVVS